MNTCTLYIFSIPILTYIALPPTQQYLINVLLNLPFLLQVLVVLPHLEVQWNPKNIRTILDYKAASHQHCLSFSIGQLWVQDPGIKFMLIWNHQWSSINLNMTRIYSLTKSKNNFLL